MFRRATVAVCLLFATSAFASRPFVVDSRLAERLEKGAATGEKLELRDIALIDGNATSLQLQRFEVWAPDPQIIVYENDGRSFHKLPRPETKFYKGTVNGDPESLVEISVGKNGRIAGIVIAGDRTFEIGRGVAHLEGNRVARHQDDDVSEIDRRAPLLIREYDPVEDLAQNPEAGKWECALDKIPSGSMRRPNRPTGSDALPVANGTPASGVAYSLNIAMETDAELRAAFGSDAAELTYMQDLMAKASVIYQRDLNTTLILGTTHQWTNAATDPWTVAGAGANIAAALAQMGNVWHATYSGVTRSSVVFMSGKSFGGGEAWIDTLCGADGFCGADGSNCGDAAFSNSYFGGYAFCGGSGAVTTTVPDPTLTQNGVQYGLPNTSNYWPLLELVHELGHNANGPHTHCVSLNAAQKIQYGTTRDYVDNCASGECYVGAASVPTEKGTIMSYCHLYFVSGFPQSRYRFYKSGEANELILPYFTTGLNDATVGLNATITIGSNLACAAGQTASVPANGSATFSWQIVGGNITSSTTTNSITFTPTAASVTVTVTVMNASGCAIINSATTSTQCGALAVPANLVATANGTSVTITWNTVSGATSYNVYRSTDNFLTSTSFNTVGPPLVQTGTADTAYMYKVRAFNGSTESADSNKDLAETTVFSTITQLSTKVLAANINSLRTAIDAVRKLANNGVANPAIYTDPTLLTGAAGTTVKAIHITQLRTNLDTARTTLGLTNAAYTDPTLLTGAAGTKVKAQHILDLRTKVQ